MNLLTASAEWLRRLTGWRRLGVAAALGAFSATAFPPFHFFPALLLGLAGLALLLEGEGARPARVAARIGWCFFFGQFLIGLHWIVHPLLVEPERFAWLVPFAIILMPAGLALFGMLATLVTILLVRQPGTPRLIALAIAIAAAEWLRGHILTGFPWNLPAYGWGASEAIMQSGAVIGAYGLSLLTLLLGVSLADLARRDYRMPVAMALMFALLWGFGALRLQQPNTYVPNVALRLVQPNIPQTEMLDRAYVARNWQRLMTLSSRPGNPTHIIWPESAVVFPLARNPQALEQIALLTGNTASLVAGSLRVDDQGRFFNTAYLFGPGGKPLGVYDKYHLVPFGEYLPLAPVLSRLGIAKLTAGETGYSAGPGPRSYDLPGAPALTPLICYEVIFPGAVKPATRPGWFVNITNDSWFGLWAGPQQHLLSARMRAIEEGLPIARAAITGISAVIDPKGRIVSSLPLNQSGVIDAGLPAALPPTPYARFGDLGFAIILLVCATIAGVLSQRRQTL